MPRKPAVVPITKLKVSIPLDIRAKLDLELTSDLEGRVPQGAYSEFVVARIQEHFGCDVIDLTAFGIAGLVKGPKHIIEALKKRLENDDRVVRGFANAAVGR